MAKSDGFDKRHIVMALMKSASQVGQSATSFITDMRSKGLGYRRQTMLSDWRSVHEVERKEGAVRYIRRDRYPTERTVAAVDWKLSEEYMYKVKVQSRVAPGEPIEDRFVNVMSELPLTPGEVLQELGQRWGEWERYQGEKVEKATVWSVYRRTPE